MISCSTTKYSKDSAIAALMTELQKEVIEKDSYDNEARKAIKNIASAQAIYNINSNKFTDSPNALREINPKIPDPHGDIKWEIIAASDTKLKIMVLHESGSGKIFFVDETGVITTTDREKLYDAEAKKLIRYIAAAQAEYWISEEIFTDDPNILLEIDPELPGPNGDIKWEISSASENKFTITATHRKGIGIVFIIDETSVVKKLKESLKISPITTELQQKAEEKTSTEKYDEMARKIVKNIASAQAAYNERWEKYTDYPDAIIAIDSNIPAPDGDVIWEITSASVTEFTVTATHKNGSGVIFEASETGEIFER